jgi:2OG-Fe(II) oxygenase superfamily
MNKLIIAPRIVVYKTSDLDVQSILSMAKYSENHFEDNGLMGKWGDWAALWKGKSAKANNKFYKIDESDNDVTISQKQTFNKMRELYNNAICDYVEMFKDMDGWFSFIENWDLDGDYWKRAPYFDFLKYDVDQPDDLPDHPLAMNYHTDYNKQDEGSPIDKLVITATMYLNDDYEGGEISIYDPVSKSAYNYKPKAGDITVFPSGMDYFHGVLPFSGEDRYLIRTFMEYIPKPSDAWIKGVEEYGREKWEAMHHEMLSEGRKNGFNLRNVIMKGQQPSNTRFETIYLDKEPVYIDGRKDA